MTIKVEILADSISADQHRMISILAKYPRIVHSEVLRHRPLSHSVSSSRAVPVMRMLREVIADPAEPVAFGSNQPGMVAGKNLTGLRRAVVRGAWHTAKWGALGAAFVAAKAGAHKQVANRIIEPWTHTVEIISGTDWDDFFRLRIHPDADPTICELAFQVKKAVDASRPRPLFFGDWHLPLITEQERLNFHSDVLRRVSAARCARASYLNHDKSSPLIARDLDLAARLEQDSHWSPFEHQATPDEYSVHQPDVWFMSEFHGNLTGFVQDRKLREAA